MSLKFDVKVNGVEEITRALNSIITYGNNADRLIVEEIANSSTQVLQSRIPINYGDLRSSIRNEFYHLPSYASVSIYTESPYAKYVNFGTSGTWWTPLTSETLNTSKMLNYPFIKKWYRWYDNGNGKLTRVWMGYKFNGQEGKHFFEDTLNVTQEYNLDLAKNIYLDEITRGI